MNLRFHWMLPKRGEMLETARVLTTRTTSLAAQPDMPGWIRFAQGAEEAGIESVLLSFSHYEPDTLLVACGLGRETSRLKYIAAYRLGLMQPTTFVQQVNTLSTLTNGRIALNIVAGSSSAEQRGYGDFLKHDERYCRAKEFLTICHAFWNTDEVNFNGQYYQVEQGRLHTPFLAPDRHAPEIYISGHSEQARQLALSCGSCWLRVIDTPEKLAPIVARTRQHGIEVCLRLAVVCRPTRQAAIQAAEALQSDAASIQQVRQFLAHSDSQMFKESLAAADDVGWLNHCLWAGLVPSYGSTAMTLVGTPEELTQAFLAYKRIGVTQFILSGWPKLEEMCRFGREVIPRIRSAEQHHEAQGAWRMNNHTERYL